MDSTVVQENHDEAPWRRECGVVACLVVLVLLAYFLRMGEMPIQGEEPTRALIAYEMVQTGNWVVPMQQGRPFLTRPPLQNWLIAVTCAATGSWEPWAVRLHSVLAMLFTTLIIYGYGRVFLSRLGAFAAALAFATMAHVLMKGAQAETDPLFIFCISGSLLVWHWGVMRGWSDYLTFSCGYALMALGSLTKGLQAPTYFVGAIGVYLVLTWQWRRLFSLAHLVGIAVCAAIHLAWVLPHAQLVGWSGAYAAWMGDVAMTHNSEMDRWQVGQTLLHLLTYPFAVLAAILPWSLMLLLFLRKDFRASIGAAKPMVFFAVVCIAVALPTCWFPAGGLVRYFAPLYPTLALLIGLAIQRCVEAETTPTLQPAWRLFVGSMAGAMVLAAVVIVTVSALGVFGGPVGTWAETPLVALLFALILVASAVIAWRARKSGTSTAAYQAMTAVAIFMMIGVTGVYTNRCARRCIDPTEAIARLRQQVPADEPLPCLGYENFDASFGFHFRPLRIKGQPWPTKDSDCESVYFGFRCDGDGRPKLPFAWEEIGAVSVDRYHREPPEQVFVIGRRLSPAKDARLQFANSASRAP